MNIGESILLAFDSVRVNKLRASLTLLSVAIGVFAIMGAGSLISSLDNTIEQEMSELGSTTFYISRTPNIMMGNWHKYMKRKPITYSQFKELDKVLKSAEMLCPVGSGGGFKVKSGGLETDQDVSIAGCDETYFRFRQMKISQGRLFTRQEVELNHSVAVIGNDIAVKIFPNIDPIGKTIKVGIHDFTVVGLLEPKGAVLGHSEDNYLLIPITQFLKYYTSEWSESLMLLIRAYNSDVLQETMDDAIGAMRSIRNVKPWEENSFEIETNDSITQQFAGITGFISIFGYLSGFIALIAAGVGIMNIMLVSVKERTREIGVRKAVGAKRSWIITQFIIEAVTLCQLGGLIGVVFGYIAASILGNMAGFHLIIPVNIFISSIIICTVIGLVSGAYPAWKAAKIDPIEALRYE